MTGRHWNPDQEAPWPASRSAAATGAAVWRAHYRTPAGAQRNKSFPRKIDAERFLASVESSKNTGDYVDPLLARVTIGEWARSGWTGRPTSSPPP